MRIDTYRQATALPEEEALLERLNRLHKRSDRSPIDVIGVENADGQLRLRITFHTEAEDDNACRLLEDRKFYDRIGLEETTDEDGNIEVGAGPGDPTGEFSAIYAPRR